jgi:osmotically-inducible protein OsmY
MRRPRGPTAETSPRWHGALLLLSFCLTLGACATIDPLEDTRIEAEVKARLVAERDANLTRLGVVSSEGTVYLSGTVESADEKARAQALASGVRGVRRVVNTLDVRSTPR